MPSLAWLAATTGQPPLAQHINQFHVVHPTQYIYTGISQAAVSTNGASAISTNNLWLAQSFTTGASQTTIGYVLVPVSTTTTTGASLAPTTLSLYADSAGAPGGSALVSTTITAEYAYLTTNNGNTNLFTTIPLPITGLSVATQYWLVLTGTSSTGHFTWFQSASVSGASTSPTGSVWTPQAYGLRYNVFDQSVAAPAVALWEDSGQRWSLLQYNSTLQLTNLSQYTGGQTASGYNQGYRTYSYTNGLVKGLT